MHFTIIEDFKKYFNTVTLKKNEYLVEQGKICPFFCYVESGILQHTIEVNEIEKTTYLSLKKTFTSSLKSFLNEIPSRKSVKAITTTKILVINKNDFKSLIDENEKFKQFYYDLIEYQICLIDDYRIDLLSLTPEERYKKLLENEPILTKEVPLHYLASFLGISTRNMSRIRKTVF